MRRSQRSKTKVNYIELEEDSNALATSAYKEISRLLLQDQSPVLSSIQAVELFDIKQFDQPLHISDTGNVQVQMMLDMKIPSYKNLNDMCEIIGPEKRLHTIDVASQSQGPKLTFKQMVDYFYAKTSHKEQLLNVTSLDIAGTPLQDQILAPKFVRDLDLVEQVWPKEDTPRPQVKEQKETKDLIIQRVLYYVLLSVAGCFTDFHIDFGGSSVWYYVVFGRKNFLIIPPSAQNLQEYKQWASSERQNITYLASKVENAFQVHVKAGETIYLPSGWAHAVVTLEDSLVYGGNFLHTQALDMQAKIWFQEQDLKMNQKFRFPLYEKLIWYTLVDFYRYYVKVYSKLRNNLEIQNIEAKDRINKQLVNEFREQIQSHITYNTQNLECLIKLMNAFTNQPLLKWIRFVPLCIQDPQTFAEYMRGSLQLLSSNQVNVMSELQLEIFEDREIILSSQDYKNLIGKQTQANTQKADQDSETQDAIPKQAKQLQNKQAQLNPTQQKSQQMIPLKQEDSPMVEDKGKQDSIQKIDLQDLQKGTTKSSNLLDDENEMERLMNYIFSDQNSDKDLLQDLYTDLEDEQSQNHLAANQGLAQFLSSSVNKVEKIPKKLTLSKAKAQQHLDEMFNLSLLQSQDQKAPLFVDLTDLDNDQQDINMQGDIEQGNTQQEGNLQKQQALKFQQIAVNKDYKQKESTMEDLMKVNDQNDKDQKIGERGETLDANMYTKKGKLKKKYQYLQSKQNREYDYKQFEDSQEAQAITQNQQERQFQQNDDDVCDHSQFQEAQRVTDDTDKDIQKGKKQEMQIIDQKQDNRDIDNQEKKDEHQNDNKKLENDRVVQQKQELRIKLENQLQQISKYRRNKQQKQRDGEDQNLQKIKPVEPILLGQKPERLPKHQSNLLKNNQQHFKQIHKDEQTLSLNKSQSQNYDTKQKSQESKLGQIQAQALNRQNFWDQNKKAQQVDRQDEEQQGKIQLQGELNILKERIERTKKDLEKVKQLLISQVAVKEKIDKKQYKTPDGGEKVCKQITETSWKLLNFENQILRTASQITDTENKIKQVGKSKEWQFLKDTESNKVQETISSNKDKWVYRDQNCKIQSRFTLSQLKSMSTANLVTDGSYLIHVQHGCKTYKQVKEKFGASQVPQSELKPSFKIPKIGAKDDKPALSMEEQGNSKERNDKGMVQDQMAQESNIQVQPQNQNQQINALPVPNTGKKLSFMIPKITKKQQVQSIDTIQDSKLQNAEVGQLQVISNNSLPEPQNATNIKDIKASQENMSNNNEQQKQGQYNNSVDSFTPQKYSQLQVVNPSNQLQSISHHDNINDDNIEHVNNKSSHHGKKSWDYNKKRQNPGQSQFSKKSKKIVHEMQQNKTFNKNKSFKASKNNTISHHRDNNEDSPIGRHNYHKPNKSIPKQNSDYNQFQDDDSNVWEREIKQKLKPLEMQLQSMLQQQQEKENEAFWYYFDGTKEQGPFSKAQIGTMLDHGEVDHNTTVYDEHQSTSISTKALIDYDRPQDLKIKQLKHEIQALKEDLNSHASQQVDAKQPPQQQLIENNDQQQYDKMSNTNVQGIQNQSVDSKSVQDLQNATQQINQGAINNVESGQGEQVGFKEQLKSSLSQLYQMQNSDVYSEEQKLLQNQLIQQLTKLSSTTNTQDVGEESQGTVTDQLRKQLVEALQESIISNLNQQQQQAERQPLQQKIIQDVSYQAQILPNVLQVNDFKQQTTNLNDIEYQQPQPKNFDQLPSKQQNEAQLQQQNLLIPPPNMFNYVNTQVGQQQLNDNAQSTNSSLQINTNFPQAMSYQFYSPTKYGSPQKWSDQFESSDQYNDQITDNNAHESQGNQTYRNSQKYPESRLDTEEKMQKNKQQDALMSEQPVQDINQQINIYQGNQQQQHQNKYQDYQSEMPSQHGVLQEVLKPPEDLSSHNKQNLSVISPPPLPPGPPPSSLLQPNQVPNQRNENPFIPEQFPTLNSQHISTIDQKQIRQGSNLNPISAVNTTQSATNDQKTSQAQSVELNQQQQRAIDDMVALFYNKQPQRPQRQKQEQVQDQTQAQAQGQDSSQSQSQQEVNKNAGQSLYVSNYQQGSQLQQSNQSSGTYVNQQSYQGAQASNQVPHQLQVIQNQSQQIQQYQQPSMQQSNPLDQFPQAYQAATQLQGGQISQQAYPQQQQNKQHVIQTLPQQLQQSLPNKQQQVPLTSQLIAQNQQNQQFLKNTNMSTPQQGYNQQQQIANIQQILQNIQQIIAKNQQLKGAQLDQVKSVLDQFMGQYFKHKQSQPQNISGLQDLLQKPLKTASSQQMSVLDLLSLYSKNNQSGNNVQNMVLQLTQALQNQGKSHDPTKIVNIQSSIPLHLQLAVSINAQKSQAQSSQAQQLNQQAFPSSTALPYQSQGIKTINPRPQITIIPPPNNYQKVQGLQYEAKNQSKKPFTLILKNQGQEQQIASQPQQIVQQSQTQQSQPSNIQLNSQQQQQQQQQLQLGQKLQPQSQPQVQSLNHQISQGTNMPLIQSSENQQQNQRQQIDEKGTQQLFSGSNMQQVQQLLSQFQALNPQQQQQVRAQLEQNPQLQSQLYQSVKKPLENLQSHNPNSTLPSQTSQSQQPSQQIQQGINQQPSIQQHLKQSQNCIQAQQNNEQQNANQQQMSQPYTQINQTQQQLPVNSTSLSFIKSSIHQQSNDTQLQPLESQEYDPFTMSTQFQEQSQTSKNQSQSNQYVNPTASLQVPLQGNNDFNQYSYNQNNKQQLSNNIIVQQQAAKDTLVQSAQNIQQSGQPPGGQDFLQKTLQELQRTNQIPRNEQDMKSLIELMQKYIQIKPKDEQQAQSNTQSQIVQPKISNEQQHTFQPQAYQTPLNNQQYQQTQYSQICKQPQQQLVSQQKAPNQDQEYKDILPISTNKKQISQTLHSTSPLPKDIMPVPNTGIQKQYTSSYIQPNSSLLKSVKRRKEYFSEEHNAYNGNNLQYEQVYKNEVHDQGGIHYYQDFDDSFQNQSSSDVRVLGKTGQHRI